MAQALVRTVLGDVPADQIGRTQMHEHLLLDIYPSRWSYAHILDDLETAVDEMQGYRAAGGGTLVEVTVRGAGRNPAGLREISQRTGVHIVMGTGFLWGSAAPGEAGWVRSKMIDELAQAMVADLTEGDSASGVKAGLIGEIGSGSARSSGGHNHLTAEEERLLRAAARAQRATGALIYTDTFHGELALSQLAILSAEGVRPERVVIGHLGDRRHLDYYVQIADSGAGLGFDHAGMLDYAPDAWRVETLRALVERGYGAQIVLSMDVHRKTYWHCLGGLGYDYLLTRFVPMLKAAGLSENVVEMLLAGNPQRLLPFQG